MLLHHSFTFSGLPHFQPPFPLPELRTTKFRPAYLTFAFIVLLSFCGTILLVFHLYLLCFFREPFQFLLHCSLYPQAASRSGRVVGALLECFFIYSVDKCLSYIYFPRHVHRLKKLYHVTT